MSKQTGVKLARWAFIGLLLILFTALVACDKTEPESTSAQTLPTPIVEEETLAEQLGYVGSKTCYDCHPGKYNDFMVSGHPWSLRTADVAKNSPLPLPAGYDWEIISYTIGGYEWKVDYVDHKGYIITTAGGEPGNNQYNLMTGTWSDYQPGEEKPFDCGSCHATGYSPEGNQGGLEGIVGTWVFEGIQCEACHGPGETHVELADRDAIDAVLRSVISINTSSASCGSCHARGDPTTEITAEDGFISNHQQYNELLASPHSFLSCVTCHDPHKKAELSIVAECADCHKNEAAAFTGSTMQQVGVSCTDCHMPMATQSAVSLGSYMGDVRTHLFRINTDPNASMFDGGSANDFVTLDFACLQCHQDKDIQWAGNNTEDDIHSQGK